MIRRHVANEGAILFVAAYAAIEPAQEKRELRDRGERESPRIARQ